jgi:hypothetical protein
VSEDDQDPRSVDVEGLMRRSADTAAPFPFPVRFMALICAVATALGAAYDVPTKTWGPGWFVRQAIVIVVLTMWVYACRRLWHRARLRPAILGKSLIIAAYASVALLYVAATALALGLREAGVPLPCTVAGLAAGLTLVVGLRLFAARLNARYRQRVQQGHW